jgi:hypothetical protein
MRVGISCVAIKMFHHNIFHPLLNANGEMKR